MQPLDLLKTARDLVKASNSRPRQANLLRATSTIYYAIFHTLARCSADVLIGGTGAERSGPAWNQVYRALEHGPAKKRCQNSDIISKFPAEIQDFANLFAAMQSKRHLADYDPAMTLDKSTVITDLLAAEKVIKDFLAAPTKDRRAFAAYVLFKTRIVGLCPIVSFREYVQYVVRSKAIREPRWMGKSQLVATARKGGEARMAKSTKVGRSAVSGRFTSVKTAKSKPNTHVVETIKKGK